MKLVKTTTHPDTVVLTNREYDLLQEPDSQLTVIISEKVNGQFHEIDRIEYADIPYSLTHIKREGFAYYEGRKIVYMRPLSPIKPPRKPRAKKQICVRGHDTFVVGRNSVGACNSCVPLHTKASNLKIMLANARKKLAKPDQLQGLNADEPAE